MSILDTLKTKSLQRGRPEASPTDSAVTPCPTIFVALQARYVKPSHEVLLCTNSLNNSADGTIDESKFAPLVGRGHTI